MGPSLGRHAVAVHGADFRVEPPQKGAIVRLPNHAIQRTSDLGGRSLCPVPALLLQEPEQVLRILLGVVLVGPICTGGGHRRIEISSYSCRADDIIAKLSRWRKNRPVC